MPRKRRLPVTVVILAHNEVDQLRELLPTLSWAKEIVLIDDGSSDETITVARDWGAKVYCRLSRGDFAGQRNFGLTKASNPWVLFIDPDERLSDGIVDEIGNNIKNNEYDGYLIKRLDYFRGKQLNYGETGNCWLLRLAKKEAGKWKRDVHEVWQVKNPKKMSQPIYHYSHSQWSDSIKRIKNYANLDAKLRQKQKEHWSLFELMVFPIGKFVHNYILRRGFLDGWGGLYMALLMSVHSFGVRWYMMINSLKTDGRVIVSSTSNLFLSGYLLAWWLIIFLVPFGQLGRWEISGNVAIYLIEILMLLAIGLWVLLHVGTKKSIKTQPVWIVGWGFSLVLLMSLVVNWHYLPSDVATLAMMYWVRWVLYGLFAFTVFESVRNGWIKSIWKDVIIFWALCLAAFGLIQYIIMPDMRWLYAYGWDDHYYRLVGTIFDPGYLGLLLVLGLIALEERLTRWWWVGYIMVFIALLLTYARSAYLVFLLTMPILALYRKSWWHVLSRILLLISFVGLIWILPKAEGEGVNLARTYSITHRVRSVVTGWDVFRQHPVWGVGFNAYPYYADLLVGPADVPHHPSAPDSSWVLVLASSGIVGGMALVAYAGALMWYSRKQAVILASLAAILIHSMTNNSLFYPFVMVWMGILIGGIESEV